MRKIEDVAAFIFIIAVGVLSAISMLGVWDFFNKDVISKSTETLGLLALVAIIVMVAGKFIEGRSQQEAGTAMPVLPNPVFKTIRQITLTILIISVSLLAILGVLAIWEVIKDKDVLYKSLSSVGIIAFGTLIITITSLEREGNRLMNREGKSFSAGTIVLILFLAYVLFSFFLRW
jgi:uncharacterized protein YggT (Ycf19 family)